MVIQGNSNFKLIKVSTQEGILLISFAINVSLKRHLQISTTVVLSHALFRPASCHLFSKLLVWMSQAQLQSFD